MPQPHRSACLVLIVDDDADVRDSLSTLLGSMGYLTSTAAGVGEAILEIGAQRPDVILTDLYMIDGDGYELISTLQSFNERLPIVVMSGRGSIEKHLGVAQRLGAVATIEKPFTGAQVVEIIDRVIGNRLAA